MKRALIVYATREGQTRKISLRIARHLSDRGIDVAIHDAKDPWTGDIGAFDISVFGASMHAGGVERELVRFMTDHKSAMRASVSGKGRDQRIGMTPLRRSHAQPSELSTAIGITGGANLGNRARRATHTTRAEKKATGRRFSPEIDVGGSMIMPPPPRADLATTRDPNK